VLFRSPARHCPHCGPSTPSRVRMHRRRPLHAAASGA